MRYLLTTVLACTLSLLVAQNPFGVAGHTQVDIDPLVMTGDLDSGDKLGASFATLGMLTGTANTVIAVGTKGDDFDTLGLSNSGAVWLYEIGSTGEMNAISKIDAEDIPDLNTDHNFGESIDNIGDFDGDGVDDIIVGAPFDSLPGMVKTGSIYLVLLESNGDVKSYKRITNTLNGLPAGAIADNSRFGSAVRGISDLDGNGVRDFLVGAPYDGVASDTSGALYVLFMKGDGTVKKYRKIDRTETVLAGSVANLSLFGRAIAYIGTIGPGFDVIAVGAPGSDSTGSVHLISLKSTGAVNSNSEFNGTHPLLATGLDFEDRFGFSLGLVGDLDGDGRSELGVGAPFDDDTDDGFMDKGAMWILYLNEDGTLRETSKISVTSGGFGGYIGSADFFGNAVATPGDIDGDGLPDMLIGARNEVVGGNRTGNFFLMKCVYCRTPQNLKSLTLADTSVGFTWDHVPSKKGYEFSWKPSSSTIWNTVLTTNNVVVLDTLDPGETYDWQVVSGCGGSLESYDSDLENHILPRLSGSAGVSLVPNPANDYVIVTHNLKASEVDVKLIDITGAVRISRTSNGYNSVMVDGLGDLPDGTYWVELSALVEGVLEVRRSKLVLVR